MANQVIYKKRFLNKLDKLLKYLEEEWSPKIADEFLDKLEECIQSITLHPKIGNTTLLKNTRCILITKHNKVYYRIEKNKVIVLNIIDTRRNPEKNPFNKSQ
jgi:plasmid stabilization system protein ParE